MNPTQRAALLRQIKCEVKADVPLAPYTSFRIGGPAAILAEPASTGELVALFRILREEGCPWFYLGHGSNILIADQGIEGVVVRARGELSLITAGGATIVSGPAARLLDLTTYSASLGLSGMEPLCGIPGSVGGGLWMNAGAYGGEISDGLLDVEVLTPEGEVHVLKRHEIGFGYRSAPALRDVIVLFSRYRLVPGSKANIYREMRRVWKLRRAKQPLNYPSAGSVFKRPPGDFAGRLIEEVGGKGVRVGGAMISPKHAGFIINVGGATASDVASLIRDIRRRVWERFGILLENEVQPVGFREDPFAITP